MMRLLTLTLCFVLILCMHSVFAMDNYSEKSEPCNEEESIDLTQYKKQELNLDNLNSDFEVDAYVIYNQKILISDNVFENCKPETKYHVTNVSNTSKENGSRLKRKKKPDKFETLLCETCQRETEKYLTGKFSKKSVCHPCYSYEYRHGELRPPGGRNNWGKHMDQILVCEHCQKESNRYVTGKFSGKAVCKVCYTYEYRYGRLRPQGERNYYAKHKDQLDNLNSDFEVDTYVTYNQKILISDYMFENCKPETKYHVTNVSNTSEENFNGLKRKKKQDKFKILLCEICQIQTKKYLTGKFSKKSVCHPCYSYEYRYGELRPQGGRNNSHKDKILVCENCQNDSKFYLTGKFSGKSVCKVCYTYEYRYGRLRSQGERNYYAKHKDKILVCETCQKESNRYITGKFSSKSLCQVCYAYEYRNGRLRPQGEQNYYGKHKDRRNDLSNRLFEEENSQNTDRNDSTNHSTEQQKKYE